MKTRTFGLVSALLALAAQAQPATAPPLIASDTPQPGACGVCSEGAECISGACQFTCGAGRGCRGDLICIGADSGGRGVCEPRLAPQIPGMPAMIRRGDATHADRFRASDTVPLGFHVAEEPSWGMVAGGLATFAVGYLPVVLIGAAMRTPQMAIPIVGVILGFRPYDGWFAGFVNGLIVAGIVLDIAAQVAGLCMVIAGLTQATRWLERDLSKPKLSFVPTAPGASLGASLVGQF